MYKDGSKFKRKNRKKAQKTQKDKIQGIGTKCRPIQNALMKIMTTHN